MKRVFRRDENGKNRQVLTYNTRLQIYHPECAPENSKPAWTNTQKTYCAKCFKDIFR